MELDTGAARSLISKNVFESLFHISNKPKVVTAKTTLKKYGGIAINLHGEISVNVTLNKITKRLVLLIVNEDGPALLGRDWINAFKLQILGTNVESQILNNSSDDSTIPKAEITKFLDNFKSIFKPGLGTLQDVIVSLDIIPYATPKFLKARPVPFSLKDKINDEIDFLLQEGIIEPVNYSTWACPIVPVLKPNGKIRICGDYKITANKAIRCEAYPLPKPKELLSTLAGGKFFAKLDLSHAYNQLKLDEKSKLYTTINTHRGLFRYTRLCFGINSASAIFQRHSESLMKGLERVLVFSDDIFISGRTKSEFLDKLRQVLSILENAGLRLNRDKCQWCLKEITYLGYRVTADGIYPTNEKIKAILNAPPPKNITQLQAFLGLLNFYRSFIPNASSVLESLNKLLRKDVEWHWEDEQNKAFNESKSILLNSDCLVHYDPRLPIVVSADSSSYGLGCAISHVINGIERPISFASRTLTPAERNYSQLEREALALIYALKQFHFYIYGYEFTLKTDHKPLLGIFSPDKTIPLMASGRIIRWCLMMQAYKFKLLENIWEMLMH